MNATFQVDQASLRKFHNAIQAYAKTSTRSLKDILNQKLLDVAVTAFQAPRPQTAGNASSLQFQRDRVHDYLWRQMAQYVKVSKRGISKGKFVRRKGLIKSKKQLYLVNLIVNKIRGRQGKKGLYGSGQGKGGEKSMAKAAGDFARRAQVSVGYLKSVWLPIIRALLPHAKFRKYSWSTLATGLARWMGSLGYQTIRTTTTPANQNALGAFVEIKTKVRGPRVELARRYQVEGASIALEGEANDLLKRAIEKLSQAPERQ